MKHYDVNTASWYIGEKFSDVNASSTHLYKQQEAKITTQAHPAAAVDSKKKATDADEDVDIL